MPSILCARTRMVRSVTKACGPTDKSRRARAWRTWVAQRLLAALEQDFEAMPGHHHHPTDREACPPARVAPVTERSGVRQPIQ